MTFWERVKAVFVPPVKNQYLIVELPANRTQARWTPEIKASVQTLQAHPGFVALLDKLRLQRATIATQLTNVFHKDLRQVDYLQAGVFWLGYLEAIVSKSTNTEQRMLTPEEEEMEAFRAIDSQIRRLE